MPDIELLQPVVSVVLTWTLDSSLQLLGVILQHTNAFNFCIMSALAS